MKLRVGCVVVGFLSFVLSMAAQTSGSSPASAQVPPLIQFSNVATDEGGSSLSGVVNITFSLYNGQTGGEPLWTETQRVELDPTGHYSAQLGITKPAGVPTALFTTGAARWLGVQIAQQPEQPRVLLLSVPYALKAGDAATIGGLPPSAFVLAAPPSGVATTYITEAVTGQTSSPETATDVTTTGGTANYLPVFNGTSTIIDSVVYQSGTGSTARIGINTTTPSSTLGVNGAATIGGLTLPAEGTATATAGDISHVLNLVASAFNSSTSKAVSQTFRWDAEPAGNNTPSPSATLNLLFGSGTSKPTETGLNVASNGHITFASGQTFPGTGDGTVTSVGSGLGLTGGPITTSGTLTIDTTVVPQLNTANTFTGNQTVNGTLSATGPVTGSYFQIGSSPFAWGAIGLGNAFLGFAGTYTISGLDNTAIGVFALSSTTTGYENTASGYAALSSNTTGYDNTASGYEALLHNTEGSDNTAIGIAALYSNTNGSLNTAIGAAALDLNTKGSENTASGYAALNLNTTGIENTASGFEALARNTTGYYNTANGGNALFNNTTGYENTAVGVNTADNETTSHGLACVGYNTCGGSLNLHNAGAFGANATVEMSDALVLGSVAGVNGATATVRVGIGTTKPTNLLTLGQGFGPSISDGWTTYSSRRWKTNIQPLHNALRMVEQLRGVSYDLKDSGKHEIGVIAEEVGAVVPEVVSYEENGKDARGVDYSRLTALLIEATKEQQRELAKALRQIRQQQGLLRAQSAAMRSLEAEVREDRETLRKVKAQVVAVQPMVVAAK
jgi:hypothetical protein